MAKSDVPAAVAADPEKLRQILGNLIDNAVKYSPDGGVIRVAYATLGHRLRFSVADEGIGIPPEERERIFEKFYRLDPELLRGVGGTGLGPVHLPRARRSDARLDLGRRECSRRLDVLLRAAARRRASAQEPGRLRSRPGGVLVDQ